MTANDILLYSWIGVFLSKLRKPGEASKQITFFHSLCISSCLQVPELFKVAALASFGDEQLCGSMIQVNFVFLKWFLVAVFRYSWSDTKQGSL